MGTQAQVAPLALCSLQPYSESLLSVTHPYGILLFPYACWSRLHVRFAVKMTGPIRISDQFGPLSSADVSVFVKLRESLVLRFLA